MKKLIIGFALYTYGNQIYGIIKMLQKIINIAQTTYGAYKYLTHCKCSVCEYNRNNHIHPVH
jgi:hypothetical protein